MKFGVTTAIKLRCNTTIGCDSTDRTVQLFNILHFAQAIAIRRLQDSSPMVLIRLQRLITAIGQQREHDAGEGCLLRKLHTGPSRLPWRSTTATTCTIPRCGLRKRQHLAGDLSAVERVDRQQINQAPQNIHVQQFPTMSLTSRDAKCVKSASNKANGLTKFSFTLTGGASVSCHADHNHGNQHAPPARHRSSRQPRTKIRPTDRPG